MMVTSLQQGARGLVVQGCDVTWMVTTSHFVTWAAFQALIFGNGHYIVGRRAASLTCVFIAKMIFCFKEGRNT